MEKFPLGKPLVGCINNLIREGRKSSLCVQDRSVFKKIYNHSENNQKFVFILSFDFYDSNYLCESEFNY